MLERMLKLTFTFTAILGVLAIVLILIGGSYTRQSGDAGFSLNIRLGAESGFLPVIMGAISIGLLVIGVVLLLVARQAKYNHEARAFGEYLQELHRSSSDCKIAGVCGGIADGTPVPSWAWRLLFLVLTFCYGVGLLPYVILWICLPVKQAQAS